MEERGYLMTDTETHTRHVEGSKGGAVVQASITVFRGATDAEPVGSQPLVAVLESIRRGEIAGDIERLRRLYATNEDQYDKEKKKLRAVTFGGTFSRREKTALEAHSGFIVLDLDDIAETLSKLREEIERDRYTYSCFLSPSGAGLKVVVRIEATDQEQHERCFDALKSYYLEWFKQEIDPSGRDVCRLCFLSYDPALTITDSSDTFPLPPVPARPAKAPVRSAAASALIDNGGIQLGDVDKVRHLLSFIPRPEYHDWIKIIGAVRSVLSDADAASVLQEWSPEESIEGYHAKLRKPLETIGAGTLVFMAKAHGYTNGNGSKHRAPAASVPPSDGTPGDAPRSAAPEQGKALTDIGNGERLAMRYGDDIRYCHDWAKWLVWDGARWNPDGSGELEYRAKLTVRNIYAEAADEENDDRRRALVSHAGKSESAGRILSMIRMAQSEPGITIRHTELDRNHWLLNVENSTIDLRTGTLRPADRNDLITKVIPVTYDPAAGCPHWERFLLEIMADDTELVDYLRRAIGYALTGDVSEQCLFFFYGHGSNGKSTFITTIQKLLGEYAYQAPRGFLMAKKGESHPTETARLFGARYVVCTEVEQGQRLSEVMVKDLTGSDEISTRRMREDFWSFAPTHKLFIAGNHKPEIRGTDNGIWRRLRLVPFSVTITKVDKELPAKLEQELPGILAWAVRGCLEWQQRRTEGKDGLGTPDPVKKATADYRSDMDTLGTFIADRLVVADGAMCLAGLLHAEYLDWCDKNGEKPASMRVFGVALQERGFGSKRDNRGIVRLGIGIKARDQ